MFFSRNYLMNPFMFLGGGGDLYRDQTKEKENLQLKFLSTTSRKPKYIYNN